MCIFNSAKPKGAGFTPGVAPIPKTDTSLPEAKPLVKDVKTDVTYGGKNKKPETLATRKTGTQALKIPLNVTGQGSNINV